MATTASRSATPRSNGAAYGLARGVCCCIPSLWRHHHRPRSMRRPELLFMRRRLCQPSTRMVLECAKILDGPRSMPWVLYYLRGYYIAAMQRRGRRGGAVGKASAYAIH
jgi:hypothetical protein